MKVTIDTGTCTGCELCTQVCPEVFEMDNGIAKAKAAVVPAAAEASAKEAADSCPVACISLS